jgi:hypothetical protein
VLSNAPIALLDGSNALCSARAGALYLTHTAVKQGGDDENRLYALRWIGVYIFNRAVASPLERQQRCSAAI